MIEEKLKELFQELDGVNKRVRQADKDDDLNAIESVTNYLRDLNKMIRLEEGKSDK